MGESRGERLLVLAILAPAFVWACGGASEKGSANPGAGGSGKAGASSTAGSPVTAGGGATAGGKSAGTSGSDGTVQGGAEQVAGGGAVAEGGASAGVAGAGGAAEPWDPELLGFACDSKRCAVGQACLRCVAASSSGRICVPSPSGDPAGFEAATAGCEMPLATSFDECDGPEDCPAAAYCVAAEGGDGFMRCRDEPSTVGGSCCFACGALTDCTLCRSAADCPDHVACEPAQSAPDGIMGCSRGR